VRKKVSEDKTTIRVSKKPTKKILTNLRAYLTLQRNEEASYEEAIQYLLDNCDLPEEVKI
jgi:hypothetical protein